MIEVTASRRTYTNDSTSYSRSPSTSRLMTPAGIVEVLSFFRPYAVRSRVGFVLKRRLHQDSIERQTRLPCLQRAQFSRAGYLQSLFRHCPTATNPHHNRAEVTS